MTNAGDHVFDHEHAAPPPPPSSNDASIPFSSPTRGPVAPPAHSAAPLAAPNHEVPDVDALLVEAIEIVETARPAPLSTAIKIEGEPLLDLLYDARDRLPDELRAARWLLRDREEHLESQRLEGQEIIALARSRAERLVERTEVVRSAEHRAQRILAEAKSEARQMRRETEDFCDARLASLEGILDRTRGVVATGRARLQGAEEVDLSEQGLSEQGQHVAGPAHLDPFHVGHIDESLPEPVQPTVDLFDQDLP